MKNLKHTVSKIEPMYVYEALKKILKMINENKIEVYQEIYS
jgi:hypothetical protein